MAVGTIVARTRKLGTSWLLGAFWGLGHTITIFAVGALIILLKVSIPPRAGLSMEAAVGLTLIALGLFNLAGRGLGARGAPPRDHPHAHPDEPELGWLKRHLRDAGAFQLARSLSVGLVHGLAGSAAVALLVLATIGNPRAAVLYLLIFGLGTLVGMLILSTLMEMALLRAASSWLRLERVLTSATGLLSLVFGLWVVYDMGFVHGLFTAHPEWIPR